MVALNRVRGRRGVSRLGCLFILLLLVAGTYYGVSVGGVYLNYYKMLDAMRSEARLAPSIDNATIKRRLRTRAEELELPESAYNVQVRRRRRPREIEITTTWSKVIELPFFTYELSFSPVAKAPL